MGQRTWQVSLADWMTLRMGADRYQVSRPMKTPTPTLEAARMAGVLLRIPGVPMTSIPLRLSPRMMITSAASELSIRFRCGLLTLEAAVVMATLLVIAQRVVRIRAASTAVRRGGLFDDVFFPLLNASVTPRPTAPSLPRQWLVSTAARKGK